MKISKALIIEFTQLPKELQKKIQGWCGFHNDCLLPFRTEFYPVCGDQGIESWETSLTSKQIDIYHQNQIADNTYVGDKTQFIKDYGLEVEIWLIEKLEKGEINLAGVEEILFNICW